MIYPKTNFKSLYGTSGTQFPDNTTGLITEAIMRAFGEDIADSFISNVSDLKLKTTATGTNSYALTGAITAYADGMMRVVKFTNASTGTVTLNENSLGAKKVYLNQTTQAGNGDIPANFLGLLVYDSSLDSGAGGFVILNNPVIGGTGGPAIADDYDDIADLLANQGDQEQNALYYVSDASTDTTVDSGWAVYRYLGTTDGDLDDYQKLSEEESLDVIFNVLGTALTGYTATSGTISATDTILQAFQKVGYFIANVGASILGTAITGYTVGSNAVLAATDTILAAFGKIQGQLNAKYDIADDDPVSVSVSSGTMTLNADSKRKRKYYAATAISSNFTIAQSNTTNLQYGHLTLNITGTVVVTLPSTFVMEADDSRFNNSTKELTLVGTTASPFELSWARHGSVFLLKRSTTYFAS